MRRRLPSLNALLVFEAAARLSGFSKAARELGVAQPAITRHITNLEEWLGVELFKRHGNSVELSEDGFAVAEIVTPTFDRLELGLKGFTSSRENEIVVGASFGIMHMWLMPQITAMRGVVSDAIINFITSENYVDFENSNVDVSIRFGNGNWPGKDASLIFTENTYVIASPEFLEQNPDIDADNLPETLQPEWMLEHGDPYDYGWMTWPRWFEYYGYDVPQIPMSKGIQNYPSVLDMVRCGEGVALGFVGLDDKLVQSGQIVRLGPALCRPEIGYYILSDSNRKKPDPCAELRKLLACVT
ncbi:MAG: LysR family transcriptional regulator [Pseudomonadota bacterium]